MFHTTIINLSTESTGKKQIGTTRQSNERKHLQLIKLYFEIKVTLKIFTNSSMG